MALTYLSDNVARQVGTTPAPALGAPLTSLFSADSAAPDPERTLGFHLSSRNVLHRIFGEVRDGDDERWWSVSGRPVVDQFGQFRGLIGSDSDLTQTRRSEAKITASRSTRQGRVGAGRPEPGLIVRGAVRTRVG